MTGKGQDYGGSAVRTEATGWGCIYFLEQMLQHRDEDLAGKRIAISGSGNVAIYAAEKALEKGARVVSLSDSGGAVEIPDGLNEQQLEFVKDLKETRRGRIAEFAEKFPSVKFHADQNPWGIACDVAMPCATQNELDEADARRLVKQGVLAVCEGANMPTTPAAAAVFRENHIPHAPGKASNAGGVAVSGLEQTQNAMRISWSRTEVDQRLQEIMHSIHKRCVEHGTQPEGVNYTDGANIAGFKKVADAIHSYGIV